MKTWCLLLGLGVLLCASHVLADHCPEQLVTPGEPDLVLAGIHMSDAHIEDVIGQFGPPASSTDEPLDDAPVGSGAADHVWHLGRATLTASTEYYHDKSGKKVESVLFLKVEGPDRAERLKTGRGLTLGDPRDHISALYGPALLSHPVNAPRPTGTAVAYCFSDDSELVFGLEHDRVTSIEVYISEE